MMIISNKNILIPEIPKSTNNTSTENNKTSLLANKAIQQTYKPNNISMLDRSKIIKVSVNPPPLPFRPHSLDTPPPLPARLSTINIVPPPLPLRLHSLDISSPISPKTASSLNASLMAFKYWDKATIEKLLLDNHADLEIRDRSQRTPLHYAVVNELVELAEALLDKGANIEARCIYNSTPLYLAAGSGKLNIIRLLLDKGANVNALSTCGFTPAMLAQVFSHTEAQQLLEEKAGHFGKIWAMQKILAARFGVPLKIFIDEGQTDLQSLNNKITYPKLLESFEQFLLSRQGSEIWEGVDFKNILDTLQHACQLEKNIDPFIQQLKQQKTVAIPTIWPGHSVGIVIDGDLLFKCNRGLRAQHLPAGILVYKINKRENLKGAIEQLVSKQSQHYFENEIDQQLKLQPIDTIYCHDQRVGNCTWASAKLILRTTLYVQLLKKGMPPAFAQAEAKKIYKEWSAQDRLSALQHYKDLSQDTVVPGKIELFTEIQKKYNRLDKKDLQIAAPILEICKQGLSTI